MLSHRSARPLSSAGSRVRCVCDALGYPGQFEVLLGQFVNLLGNGKPIRMSKRKGTMVTAEMVVDDVAAQAIGENVVYALLTDPTALALSRKISELEDLIASCARDRAPFRLTHFSQEIAAGVHSVYQACQVLPSEGTPVDAELSRARLAACDAVRNVLALTRTLIGVSAPEPK